MAEGGDLSRTLKGGSESLFDHDCVQCRAHGSRQEAIVWCKDCQQSLCNICGRYHIRNMTTHTLVTVASMDPTTPIPPASKPVPVVAKCNYHPDRDIEMHCGSHDMVYCSLCIAKEHRSCVNVQEIKDVAHTFNVSILQTLVADITKVTKRLQDTKLEKSSDLRLIKKQKASLIQEIKAVRKRMNKHLDALEQNLIAELDAEESKLEKEINVGINNVEALITSANQRKPDMTTSSNHGNQMFIIEKLARVVLTEANNFLDDKKLTKRPILKFQTNDVLCEAIEKSDQMGKIIVQRIQRRNYTVKSKNDIDVLIKSDKYASYIREMCELPDGTILLSDDRNNKLKRLDDQHNLKDLLVLKSEPCGLCSVSPTEVAVRMTDNTIHYISISKSLSYQRKVSINKFNRSQRGMACCNNQLWIPGIKAVYVYTLSGSLVKKIETDSQGRKLFTEFDPRHIAVSNDETKVYVAAWEDRVIVFNKNGDVINELRDQRLNDADCVCITEDDIVLVTGCDSGNIVMFDRDGNSVGELVSNKDMTFRPYSLCYDSKNCRMLVGRFVGNVRIFKLS